MASHQSQRFKAGETKGHTQEKTEHAMGTVKDKATEAKDRASGTAQDSTAQKTSESAQAAKERAGEAKDNTGSFLQEKNGAAKEKASDAARYTKETAQAGAQKMGGILSSAAEQVTGAAKGAVDAVKHTFGMVGTGDDPTHDTD
ncbi:hypothetical protein MKW94_025289 [Papaver nudicaule]|uniref:Uncharacterized protein n=1 Tax=Papaver nudicaule TaxID=74823 RepID=A0AA41W3J0_PAPNU|nr:hypothetical protein [Papaver nudicaule]